jgi:murein DD-endopeptidase MepM/ murein hydrolase activator NlpD
MKFVMTGKYLEVSPIRGNVPHHGIDFSMPEGTTLRSVVDGKVRLADYGNQNAGKTVLIDSDDGNTYIYGHCHDFVVKNGQNVHVGQIIAHSGNTGHSISAHLHFGVKETATGEWIDPTPIADKVASIQGNHFNKGIITELMTNHNTQGIIPMLLNHTLLREHTAEMATQIALGIGDALTGILSAVALVGSGVCIILKVAGWKDGGRWAGILMCSNILLKFLFRGI